MVKLREEFHDPDDGSIVPNAWLQHLEKGRSNHEMALIRHAFSLSQLSGEHHPTLTGQSCLQQGMAIADILDNLKLDQETIAAAIVYPSVQYAELSIEDVCEQLSPVIAKLVDGIAQMDAISILHQQTHSISSNRQQIDNLRRMLLAMAEDIRVVLIKLAERTCIMRNIARMGKTKQQEIATETRDIYGPLANRLGIWQIKWELEDLSFRYLQPTIYKKIAKLLDQKRTDREQFVDHIISTLTDSIKKAHIQHYEIAGRAKHIYSIYRKMERKDVDYSQIYDVIAVRVLVPSIENCYAALGIVHSLWPHIAEEFDDYIAHPKPNGYRSLHTAVMGSEGRHFEVQIRTFDMHQESELGVAAHWIYKEGGGARSSYDQKIAWLRQVMDWQKEITGTDNTLDQSATKIFEDRVYVFTPNSEIIDLPMGSTPLDFAYHIHTEIGHRCRGAKSNASIVPLSYQLKTGDRVEILTSKRPNPSRDWLNPHIGYLKTSRAKAKVHHWFKQQDYDKNLVEGEELLNHELKRLKLSNKDLEKIAERFNKRTINDMYAAIGSSDLRIGQIVNAIEAMQQRVEEKQPKEVINRTKREKYPGKDKGINIQGVGNLLTNMAKCCQPVPGDIIIGYITQSRGVTIHRNDCINILSANIAQKERLIDVDWGEAPGTYPVNIEIFAYDRSGLVRDITALLANEKCNVVALNTTTNKREHTAQVTLTLETPDLNQLSRLFDKVKQLSNVVAVNRS